jgi:hypothetical protein
MIPEIDIWRVANLMLKRYGDKAAAESAKRVVELAADGDSTGAAVWRRVTDAIGQLANTTPTGRSTELSDNSRAQCQRGGMSHLISAKS